MKRPEVANLHEALVFLGFTIQDTERRRRRYGTSTHAAVKQFQTAHNLLTTGEVDEATSSVINTVLTERGAIDSVSGVPDPTGRRIIGTVLHVDGSAISGMLVQAFHRRVGGEVPLGVEAATNDRGKYTITYQLPTDTRKIDLFVRAYDDKQAVVAVSPIIIGAGEQEVLDLSVADPKYRGLSEFARATEVLSPQIAGAKLDDLDADDVALLVRNTGIARENVTAWIASRRLAERT
ncbi:MAG: peptidoglycan-binding protein, partial [Gemmatimonadaceae bacterium]|nr:peptidoglycan-binding protein [Gloeobacterales cyanobacterium ES-bin-141]